MCTRHLKVISNLVHREAHPLVRVTQVLDFKQGIRCRVKKAVYKHGKDTSNRECDEQFYQCKSAYLHPCSLRTTTVPPKTARRPSSSRSSKSSGVKTLVISALSQSSMNPVRPV